MAIKTITPNEHAELMRFAFDQICDKKDWRGPIEAVVPFTHAATYLDAIVFMTGADVHSERLPTGDYLLKSVGYRMGPCGDN